MNTAILSSIVNSDSLPSIPAVAFKVLELSRQEDVSLQDVAEVIARDPALAARIMKVANSSMFGLSKQVSSIEQAMVVLGLRTVKIMSLGFSLVDSISGRSKIGFDYPRFWRRSLSTAVAARRFADLLDNVRRDEAFIAGMLCDIGMVAAERHPQGAYYPVIAEYNARPGRIEEIERRVLGVTHAQISAMMLANWSMPELLSHAVAAHHGDEVEKLEPRTRNLALVLSAASDIASLFCRDIPPTELNTIIERVIMLLGLEREPLELELERMNAMVDETASMFSVDLGAEVSFDQIRQSAMMELSNLSLQSEQDRLNAEVEAKRVHGQLHDLSMVNESLAIRANTDDLTGIANRRAFDTHLASTIECCREARRNLSLLMIDLDHFKAINDRYGHLIGDETLRVVGSCLKKINDDACFTARYGGEEFAIVIVDSTARELRELAEDIRKSIGRIRIKHGTRQLEITASVGAAHVSFDEEQLDGDEIIRRADECLLEAKQEGRNRVTVTF